MRRLISLIVAFIILLSIFLSPKIQAQEAPISKIVISEVQTEGEDATDDFIELTNRSLDNFSLDGWEIQTKATGATSDWIKRVELHGLIYPNGTIIVSFSDGVEPYLAELATFHFSTGLSVNGGHIRLYNPTQSLEEDKVGWGTALDAETQAAEKAEAPNSIQRKQADESLVDSNNNFDDFMIGLPNPQSNNIAPDTPDEPVDEEPDEPEAEEPVDPPEEEEEVGESDPETESPDGTLNIPDIPVRINELFIDPASPMSDANDEWVELFNPNNEPVALKNYKLQTGSKYSYSYIFVDEVIDGGGFLTVTSSSSNLVLSNTEGAARLIDPLGQIMSELTRYSDVETGESYAWDGFTWAWTTTPTQNSENVITRPVIEPKPIKVAVKNVKRATAVKSSSSSSKKATAKTTPKKQAVEREVFEDPAAIDSEPPLHPTVLAGTGVLVVLYGGYEYREDFRNRVFKLGRYLKTRRQNWRKLKGL